MEIRSHWLAGNDVEHRETPNTDHRSISPRYIIVHYTAASFAESLAWFLNPAAEVSCHLLIRRDGHVIQLAPFNVVTWHAGVSRIGNQSACNNFTVGIEFENLGKLSRRNGEWCTWREIPVSKDTRVVEARHRYETADAGWEVFTAPQLEAGTEIGVLLRDSYPIVDLLGHEDVSGPNVRMPPKIDPGPAFPMNSFRSYVMGNRRQHSWCMKRFPRK